MTKPQQSLAGQHERLEQETREGLGDNVSASPRKTPGGEPWGNEPMSQAALIDVLGLFQSGTLTAAVTVREE